MERHQRAHHHPGVRAGDPPQLRLPVELAPREGLHDPVELLVELVEQEQPVLLDVDHPAHRRPPRLVLGVVARLMRRPA